jgi:hypothetical protein
MAKLIFPKNNLGPDSSYWAREVENRIKEIELDAARNKNFVNNASSGSRVSSISLSALWARVISLETGAAGALPLGTPLSGLGTNLADYDMQGFTLLNISEPTISTEPATKNYVDTTFGTAEKRNFVINGGFDIWQRGTTSLATATSFLTGYTTDRWQLWRGSYASGATCSRQTISASVTGLQYGARVQRTAGNTSVANIFFSTGFETVNSIPLAGKTVTMSAWLKVGADFSGANLLMRAVSGTGTDQRIPSTYTGSNTFLSSTITPTASYVRYSVSATVPSAATQVGVYFQYTPVGTAGADDWFEVAGVQLEVGSTVSAFKRNGENYGEELSSCQRYYQRIEGTTAIYAAGIGSGTTVTTFTLPIRTAFRITPASVGYSGADMIDGTGTSQTVTALALGTCTPNSVVLNATHVLNDTAHRPYFLRHQTSTYVELNAEI